MCGEETGSVFGCDTCVKSILGRSHGWIECKSTSFPGKVYYFHTSTRCSTWQRPVPRNTLLPRYKNLRVSNSAESSTDDNVLPLPLMVSGTEGSIIASDAAPPSAFELHARRMQMYLQKNTDKCLAMQCARDDVLRNKLYRCYRDAKNELAQKLNPKKKERKKKADKISVVNPKTKPLVSNKIIRECHGIVTVSYDPVPSEVPAGAKMSNLSETTIEDSFASVPGLKRSPIPDKAIVPAGQGHQGSIFGNDRSFGGFAFKDLNLSDSENTESGIGSSSMQ